MKTKFEKQQEALERKRKAFPRAMKIWQEAQHGQRSYQKWLALGGEDYANERQLAENFRFRLAQKEAHVDSQGNPLEQTSTSSTLWNLGLPSHHKG